MSDVSLSISFLDRAQINFSLVFPVLGITIRGKFSRGKSCAHNSIAVCAFERRSYPRTFISMCAQKRVPIYFSRDGDKEAKRRIEERQRDTEEKKWKARGERYTMYIRNRGYDSTLVYFSVRFFLSSFRSLFPSPICSPCDRRGDR